MATEIEEESPLEPVAPLEAEAIAERKELYETIVGPDSEADKLKKASRDERQVAGQLDQRSLTYSEMEFEMVLQLLDKVRNDHGPYYVGKGVFLDLGSGAGKVCLAVSLLHAFEKVVGIEVIHCLNEFAGGMKTRYTEAQFPEGMAKPELDFIKGDFATEYQSKLEPLAQQVTVCLAVATCFADSQLEAMAKLADAMPEGGIIISFTQMLPKTMVNHQQPDQLLKPDEGGWVVADTQELEMMWGKSTCFVYKKVPAGYVPAASKPDEAAKEEATPEAAPEAATEN
mmetsp:Transcript_25968/g.60046  ORF Transcript_25968/g.60046 Transcript_25968/m.60046 type:complete len:285 (+) Transcript_25968:38-892(+)